MSEKKDRWPDFWRASTFQGDKKGTPKYRVEMAKKRIEDGEFKEQYGPGPSGESIYRFKPRYSNYNPHALSNRVELEKGIEEETRIFSAALSGELGTEMRDLANKYGLRGIAEVVERSPAGLIVRDMLDPLDAPEELFVRPGYDCSGLWETQSDWENPNADRRAKGDWRLEPFWPKGTRFVLRRNQHSIDMKISLLEDAIEALNEPSSKVSEKDRDEQVKKIKAKIEDRESILHESGYEVRKAGSRNAFVPMGKMPKGFDRDLRASNITDANAAFDLIDFDPSHLRDVLAYLVDGVGSMLPWRLANLLEQAREGLGYFEPIPGIDFEESD